MDDETLYRLAGLQRFRRRSGRWAVVFGVVLVLAVGVAALLLAGAR